MKAAIALVSLSLVSGCASIVSGTTQGLRADSSPQGASCDFTRSGLHLQQVVTPASTIVERSGRDIMVTCAKPGYQTASAMSSSGVEPWVFGNLFIGGIVGILVDYSTGAIHSYDSPVFVTLPPNALPATTEATTKPVG